MLKDILFPFFSDSFDSSVRSLARLPGSLMSLFMTYLREQTGRPVLLLTADENVLDTITTDLPPCAVLPEITVMPSAFVPLHLTVRRRLFDALLRMSTGSASFLVAHPSALSIPLPGPKTVLPLFRTLQVGEDMDIRELAEHLSRCGYTPTDLVRVRGEFARRGDLVDVFPINEDAPIRIETDFDSISAIRRFDPASQRSRQELERTQIYPVRLFDDTPEHRETLKASLTGWFADPGLALSLKEMCDSIEAGRLDGLDHYFHCTWADRLEPDQLADTIVLVDAPESVQGTRADFRNMLEADAAQALERGYLALTPEQLLPTEPVLDGLLDRPDSWRLSGPATRLGVHEQQRAARAEDVSRMLRSSLNRGLTMIGVRGDAEADRIGGFLFEQAIPYSRKRREKAVWLVNAPWRKGFIIDGLLSYFSGPDLFPTSRKKHRPATVHTPFFSDFSDIREGDYVVHVDYGIARYEGLRTVSVAEASEECMVLKFQGDASVMLPVSKLHLLQKYQHAGVGPVQLSSLKSRTWKKTRARVRQEVERYARELLRHYAERKVMPGIAYPPDSMWQKDFEAAFPYEETPDQKKALADIKSDMEAPHPMDRLLCGDVGFGKTEVAMRAVFKAVDHGRQVMVLAPTTVLAFQHLQTFQERFASFPVTIDMLSRFVSPRDQKETMRRFRQGEIDILIGTHRLFSNDVMPKRLGLLIIDEEQKFGVLHKEKVKMLRKNIDVLSLSATPIPRTLNMSVMGLRDISIIESPPRDRLAIHTAHITFDPVTISEAIRFELNRGGQVYFVNNHVQTIDTLAASVRQLSPDGARIAVAHGQMPERELEETMVRFFRHDIDILVCTAIIENGMDVSRANTMFIHEAHTFGLSQLYQLRGRIGRSDRPAYAYLITPGKHTLTKDARRRLQALEEFSHLGAGFRIAMLDLELRGAGELLGDRQSGHIQSVGFEMYLQMLEEAVRELKAEGRPPEIETVLEMAGIGFIPEAYVNAAPVRLSLYRRLNLAPSGEALSRILEELEDRFGDPPEPVRLLARGHTVRLTARRMGIAAVTFRNDSFILVPGEHPQLDVARLVSLMPNYPGAHMDPASGRLTVPRTEGTPIASFIQEMQQLLEQVRIPESPA